MKLSEKLKPLLLLREDNETIHYKNLEGGEKIEIDGKEYVKVKFQLVNTLDMDSAKMMDNLETENNFLSEQNKELREQIEELKNKVKLNEQLNHNLIYSTKQEFAKVKTPEAKIECYKSELANLRQKAKDRTEQIRNLENKIEKLNKLRESEMYQSHLLRQKIRMMEKKQSPENTKL